MLKNHLKLISFGLMTLFFYDNIQASQDQFDDYTPDFLDVDHLGQVLSHIDDTTIVDSQDFEKPDFNHMRCDKREDRDLAERRRINEKKRIEDLLKLHLLVMKRLQPEALPLTISLPSSPEDEESQCETNWSTKGTLNSPECKKDDIELSSMIHKIYSIENLGELSTHSSTDTVFGRSLEELELQNIEDCSDHVEL